MNHIPGVSNITLCCVYMFKLLLIAVRSNCRLQSSFPFQNLTKNVDVKNAMITGSCIWENRHKRSPNRGTMRRMRNRETCYLEYLGDTCPRFRCYVSNSPFLGSGCTDEGDITSLAFICFRYLNNSVIWDGIKSEIVCENENDPSKTRTLDF